VPFDETGAFENLKKSYYVIGIINNLKIKEGAII